MDKPDWADERANYNFPGPSDDAIRFLVAQLFRDLRDRTRIETLDEAIGVVRNSCYSNARFGMIEKLLALKSTEPKEKTFEKGGKQCQPENTP